MLEGNRCEACTQVIEGPRAARRQTKYCTSCAKQVKKQQTIESRPPEDRREYRRAYMRQYRQRHPGSSTAYVRRLRERQRGTNVEDRTGGASSPQPMLTLQAIGGLPAIVTLLLLFPFFISQLGGFHISFEAVKTAIQELSFIIIEIAGLIVLILVCWKHISGLWKDK